MAAAAFRTATIGLRGRILSLAVLPIIGLLAVVLVEHFASRKSAAAEGIYSAQRELSIQATKLASDISAMRVASDGFRVQKDRLSETAFRQERDNVNRIFDVIGKDVGATERPLVDEARRTFTEFSEAFEAYVNTINRVGRANKEGLLGALSYAGFKLKGLVGPLEVTMTNMAGPMKETLNDMLISERDFRIHQANGYINHFEMLSQRLGSLVDASKISSADLRDIKEGLSDYKTQFSDWSDTIQLSETTFNRLKARYTLLSRSIAELQVSFDARMAAARVEQASIAETQRLWVIGAFGAVVLLSALLALTIGVNISRNMTRLSTAMRQLATGDTTTKLPTIASRDEIGAMASALQVLRDGAEERQKLVTEQASASEDRLARAQGIEAAIRAFEGNIGSSLASLREVSSNMQQVSGELDSAAVEAEAQAIAAAGDTEKAAGEIESAAVAAQQLSGSVDEVAAQALRSDQAAAEALNQADRAKKVMATMLTQTERVGEIVSVINAIASQTNLLALNATIEAARAGEAGRGFAVVAAEVKELASQTSSATSEIAGQIGNIRNASNGVVEAVESMNTTIAEVSRIAASVAAAVEEQSASLGGISRNIVAASEGAMRGADGIRTVETAVADTTRNAVRVREISEKVAQEAEKLNQQVSWFLNEVRAA